MLSSELEFCLNEAFQRARDRRHEFMTVEHLLLALLDNNDAIRVLKACGADIGGLRGDLEGRVFVRPQRVVRPVQHERPARARRVRAGSCYPFGKVLWKLHTLGNGFHLLVASFSRCIDPELRWIIVTAP